MADAIRPIDEWPYLLLGPMVRRVTSDAAYVFIATRMPATAHLLVYGGRVNVADRPDVIATQLADVALDQIGQPPASWVRARR